MSRRRFARIKIDGKRTVSKSAETIHRLFGGVGDTEIIMNNQDREMSIRGSSEETAGLTTVGMRDGDETSRIRGRRGAFAPALAAPINTNNKSTKLLKFLTALFDLRPCWDLQFNSVRPPDYCQKGAATHSCRR